MKKQQKKLLISNGIFIATIIAMCCFMIGLAGGLASCEPIALFKKMAGYGLLSSLLFGPIMVYYLLQVGGRKAINKAIKIIGIALIILAFIILLCALVSQITLAICDAVYRFNHK